MVMPSTPEEPPVAAFQLASGKTGGGNKKGKAD